MVAVLPSHVGAPDGLLEEDEEGEEEEEELLLVDDEDDEELLLVEEELEDVLLEELEVLEVLEELLEELDVELDDEEELTVCVFVKVQYTTSASSRSMMAVLVGMLTIVPESGSVHTSPVKLHPGTADSVTTILPAITVNACVLGSVPSASSSSENAPNPPVKAKS